MSLFIIIIIIIFVLDFSQPREVARDRPISPISSPSHPGVSLEQSPGGKNRGINSIIDTESAFETINPIDSIEINFDRASFSNSTCIVCREPASTRMKRINYTHASDVFYSRGMIVKPGTRACQHHFDSQNKLRETDVLLIRVESNFTLMSSQEIARFFREIRKHKSTKSIYWDHFRNLKELSQEVCKDITGFDLIQFGRLVNYAKQNNAMKDSQTRTVSQAMAVFLYHLKSGVAQDEVRRLFGLKCQQRVSDFCISVLKALTDNFVNHFLGIDHLTREQLLSHMTDAAKVFAEHVWNCPGALITIYDGTYLYIQKSGDHQFQRITYSEHKHKNLLKPFMMVLPDGYIVDCFGLYLGKINDAQIMKELFIDDNEMKTKLTKKILPGDIIEVDRGFRDVKKKLKEMGYKVTMPSCKLNQKVKKSSRKRMSEEEKEQQRAKQRRRANKSRFVTKLRWIVEMINGHLKSRFKLLGSTIPNRSINHLRDYVRVASALYNFSFQPIIADGKLNKEIALAMVDCFKWSNNNEVVKFAEEQAQKRKEWESKMVEMKANLIKDFPKMSQEEIYKRISFGKYQMVQGLQYIHQHLKKNDGKYKISLYARGHYVRAQIQSRYVSSKVRTVYIKYDKEKDGREGIHGWFCDCPNGARTVGCCGHVASLIYFLAYAQHLPEVPKRIQLDLNEEDQLDGEETLIWFDADDDFEDWLEFD